MKQVQSKINVQGMQRNLSGEAFNDYDDLHVARAFNEHFPLHIRISSILQNYLSVERRQNNH